MTLTKILLLIVLVLFIVTIIFVVNGIRTKKWKKAIISVVIFLAIVLLMYFGLLRFITAM